MKREIIYKGKKLKDGEWVFGGISLFQGEATIYDINCITNSAHDVDPDTVLQFLGYKDVNSEDIFEGDVRLFKDGIGVVHWSGLSFVIKSPGSEAEDWEDVSYFVNSTYLGNIHDNPELLEGCSN